MSKYFLYFFIALACFSCEKETVNSPFIIGEKDCKTTKLDNKRVQLCLDKIEDSRCCSFCYCIWQGVATASFILKLDNESISFQLHTLNNPSPYRTDTTIRGYTIKLLKITPYPGESSKPKEAEVSVTKQ